jgi:outer membrane immunogenic protein
MSKARTQFLTTTAIAALGGGTAYAADMGLPIKGPAPVPLPYVGWQGFYLGANIGVARLNASATMIDPSYGYYGPCGGSYYGGPSSCTTSDTGLAAGVVGGYDWQSRYFVYGVAADWTWTNLKHTVSGVSLSDGYGGSYQANVDWLASFRGRMGLAVDDTLVYVTGGVALGHLKDHLTSGISIGSNSYVSLNETKVGWVAGVGVEHKFDPHWSIKGEFLYYDLGHTLPGTSTNNVDGEPYTYDLSHEVLIGQVGLNYHF